MAQEPQRGRGRPKGGGLVHRDDIVAATLDALADGGYAALSMRGVARSLDVSLGAVQHHFPTKDALWKAAMDEFLASLQRDLSDVTNPDLTVIIENLLEQGNARPGLLAVILSDGGPDSADRIDYIAGRMAEQMDATSTIIETLSADGNLRQVDARALLMLIGVGVSSIAGAAKAMRSVYGYDLDDPTERTALARALTDILGLGLLPR